MPGVTRKEPVTNAANEVLGNSDLKLEAIVIPVADIERAKDAEAVMRRHGVASSYAAGSLPMPHLARTSAHNNALAA